MARRLFCGVVAGLMLAGLSVGSLLAEDAKPERKGPPGGGREAFMKQLLEKYDADKDGKLSDEERAKAREAMSGKRGEGRPSKEDILKKFDKDGDGKLSDDEKKAAMEAMRGQRGGPGEAAGRGKGGPGEGRPSREEIIKKFDKNGDGELNEEERKAAYEAMRAQRGGDRKKPEGEKKNEK